VEETMVLLRPSSLLLVPSDKSNLVKQSYFYYLQLDNIGFIMRMMQGFYMLKHHLGMHGGHSWLKSGQYSFRDLKCPLSTNAAKGTPLEIDCATLKSHSCMELTFFLGV